MKKKDVERIVRDAFRFYGFSENRLLLPDDAKKIRQYINEKLRSIWHAEREEKKLPKKL